VAGKDGKEGGKPKAGGSEAAEAEAEAAEADADAPVQPLHEEASAYANIQAREEAI
jgi:hypothetical protein